MLAACRRTPAASWRNPFELERKAAGAGLPPDNSRHRDILARREEKSESNLYYDTKSKRNLNARFIAFDVLLTELILATPRLLGQTASTWLEPAKPHPCIAIRDLLGRRVSGQAGPSRRLPDRPGTILSR